MLLHLKIKPGSKKNQLLKDADGNWVMKVKAPPVDGKANEEVLRFLSEILRIPKSVIQLTAGFSSPFKKFQIDVLSEGEVKKRMEKCSGSSK